jgi:Lrp/AsnC family transcriptional regulator, leucine-responsive regulatory protein
LEDAVEELDREILRALQVDGRLTMAALGRRIGLSRTATLARVRRLEDEGIITGYHAEVRPEVAAPTHTARVGIVVRTPDVAAYVRRLTTFSELREAESVAGEYDILCRFASDGAERLDAILDRINGWRETVRTTTWIILKSYSIDRP